MSPTRTVTEVKSRPARRKPGETLGALRRERKRLLQEIQRLEEQSAEEGVPFGPDAVEHATSISERATRMALLRLRKGLLERVERAIERVEQGAHHLCELCGQPIARERLQALPSATLCIGCARKRA